jgi:hypothetical protein
MDRQSNWVVSDVHEYMNRDHCVLLVLLKQKWWTDPETRANNSTSLTAEKIAGCGRYPQRLFAVAYESVPQFGLPASLRTCLAGYPDESDQGARGVE